MIRHTGLPWSRLSIQCPAHRGPSDADVQRERTESSGSLDRSRGPGANVAVVFGNMGVGALATPPLPSTHQLPERYPKYSI